MDWKKPVREYIPEFRLHDTVASDRVAVRDLLCHHSGLPFEPLVKDIAFTRTAFSISG